MAYPSPRQLQLRRGNTVTISTYTGPLGEIIINTDNWGLYIQDGVTAGGHLVSGGGSSGNIYSNANVKTYLSSFDGNIIPSANVTYTLGNITHQWSSLYVSNNTIYINGVPLSIDAGGNLSINGAAISTVNYVNTQVANVDLTDYALNANVTAANVGMKGYVDQANSIQSAQITASNVGMKGYVDSINSSLQENNYQQQQSIANLQVSAYSNVNVASYLASPIPHTFGDSVTVTGNLIVQGNLFLNGNVTTLNTNNLVINDNIIYLANANPSNSVDIGFAGHFIDPIAGYQHTGFVRQASTNTWKLFSNVIPEPTGTVNFTDAIYDNIEVGNITSPTITLLNANASAQQTLISSLQANASSQQTEIASLQSNAVSQQTTINTLLANAATQSDLIIQTNANLTQANLGMKGYVDNAVSTIVIPVTYSNINVKAYTETMGFANYSNVNVAAYLSTNSYLTATTANLSLYAWNANVGGGGTNYSNVNVAAYLATATITTTGNVTTSGNIQGRFVRGDGGFLTNVTVSVAGNVVGTSPNVTLQAGAYTSVFDNLGNVTVPKLFTAGNIQTAGYLFGNGAFLTGVVTSGGSGTNYSNVNVQAYTETMGFQNYGNVNVKAYTETMGFKNYSNVNVASYLGTGQVTISNVKLAPSGNIVFADGTVQTTAASGGSNYGNGNVASYLITNGYVNTNSAYANANVTAYLPTHSGNVGVNNILGTTPNVTLVANSYSTTFDIYGNVAFGNVLYPVSINASGNVTATGSSGPRVRFLWDTWQANSNVALSSFSPSGTIGGNADWDLNQAYGLKLTPATSSQGGYIGWNSNTVVYTYDMTITASVGAGGGNGADGQWIYFGANAAVAGSPGLNTGGISVMNHYYTGGGGNRIEVYVNGTQYNIPFVGNTYAPSSITLWNASYDSFYNLTAKIRRIQNGNRMLEVYLNEAYMGAVNISSWTPAGNYFGVGAFTGGAYSNHWVRQLRIDW